jgi:acetyl-CoA C-acetyltransferase
MTEAMLVAACRTPIGKFQGSLASLPATELGAIAVRAAVERANLQPEQINEVILGNVIAAGVGQAPARQAALQAGLPPTVAAMTVNKVCGSGLKAVMLAAQAIRAGDAHAIVAGGMESMSRAPYLLERTSTSLGDRQLLDAMLRDGLTCPFSGHSMGQIAETLAREDGLTREQQDQFACESHRRAIEASEQARFAQETIPVTITTRSGKIVVSRDEGPRADTTLERLARLKPVFDPNGTVTAGNASMISDGASAVVVVSRTFLQRHQLTPLARIVSYATAGTEPRDLFIAPVSAITQVVDKAGLKLHDIDLFEINEAFAVQMLACLQRLKLPLDKVNVNGGAIALGHPIGASGARVLTTLLHALMQRDLRRGVAALCLGGGNAVAMVIERP